MDVRELAAAPGEVAARARAYFSNLENFSLNELPPEQAGEQLILRFQSEAQKVKLRGATLDLPGDVFEVRISPAQPDGRAYPLSRVGLALRNPVRALSMLLVAVAGLSLAAVIASRLLTIAVEALVHQLRPYAHGSESLFCNGVMGLLAAGLLLLVWELNRSMRAVQRDFWVAAGWDGRGRILRGELQPGEADPLNMLARFTFTILALILFFILRVPLAPLLLVGANLVFGLLVELWQPAPLLYWRARLVEETSMKTARLALNLLVGHLLLFYLAALPGKIIETVTLDQVDNPSAEQLQAWVRTYFTFPVLQGGSADALMPSVYTRLYHQAGPATSRTALDYGASVYAGAALAMAPVGLAAPEGVRLLAILILFAFLSGAAGGLVDNLYALFTPLRSLKRRYAALFRPEREQHAGLVRTLPSPVQQALFNAWLWARWAAGLLVTLAALWTVAGALLALFGQARWFPLGGQVLGYALLRSSAAQVGAVGQVGLVIFALLFLGPLLGVVFLGLFTWLVEAGMHLVRLAPRLPADGAAAWEHFLRKYGLSASGWRLAVAAPSVGLQAAPAAWPAAVYAPRPLWQGYLGARQPLLERDETEILLLHEAGHLARAGRQPWLGALGGLTFVGRAYFDLALNSLSEEAAADEFAQERFWNVRGGSPDLDFLYTAIRRYEAALAPYRAGTGRRLPQALQPAWEWYTLMFGKNLGYLHPEMALRRELLFSPDRAAFDDLKGAVSRSLQAARQRLDGQQVVQYINSQAALLAYALLVIVYGCLCIYFSRMMW